MTRFSAIGISVVAIFSSNLVGCGDGESGTYNTKELSVGGSSSTGTENRGGATTTESVGGATSSSSTGTAGQGNTSVGGATGSSSPSGGATGTNTAGGSSNGGSSSGGSSSGGSSNGASSSTVTNVGGAGGSSSSVGGSTSQGGTAPSTAGQANGGQSQGGTSAVGGSSSGQGGGVLAGNAGRGASTSGGTTATSGTAAGTTGVGGESTGGAAGAATGGTSAAGTATGGAETGGTATGGAATGGVATGGAATGGDNTGGMGTGGTTFVPIPCTASFILPADGEILTEADDVSGKYCATGFFYDLVIATDAPNGSAATLSVNGSVQSPATPVTAQNAVVKFNTAQLGTTGTQSLSVQIGTGPTGCTATAAVTVNCLGHSTCNITTPTITATHVALNGVPTAQGGDRVSSEGSSYQAAFGVTTDVEDGQAVTLNVSNGVTTTKSYAVAISGKAEFPGVTLAPDGSYNVTASCLARSGAGSTSVPLVAPVDTTGPDLTVTKVKADGTTALADGDHFSPSDLTGGALTVCGTTTATDAVDVDVAIFGALANNFCVQIGGNTPVCSPALSTTGNGACVNLPCPGNGPFDLSVTLKDKAQNPNPNSPSPLKRTWTGLTCAATNPIVQFQDPVSGGDGADPSSFTLANITSRILAASSTGTGQRKDKNGLVLGAQYDVVICTNAPAGSTATLAQGWYGSTKSTPVATTVADDTAHLCQGAQPSVAVFQDFVLNESIVKTSDFALDKATELTATVTDLNFGVGTSTIDIWVDSVTPSLILATPANFCGSYINSGTNSLQNLTFGTTAIPVIAVVTPDGGSGTPWPSTTTLNAAGQVTIPGVTFPVGGSTLTASVTKPSGNSTSYPPSGTCHVTVGTAPPPTVTWAASPAGSSPISTSLLTAPGNPNPSAVADSDPATAGWQGTLRACANLTGAAAAGVTMQFSVNGTDAGIAQNLDQTTGCASITVTAANVVPESTAVQLSARTSATVNGTGVGTITVPVDVTKPSTPENLKVTTKSRRQTSFTLTWNLPISGNPAADYEVRVSKAVIDTPAKFATAEVVPFTGTPQPIGQSDSIDVANRYIENAYHFAVQATDSVGNASSITYTAASAPTVEHFIQQEIRAPAAATNFGWAVDGTTDLNGDGYSDLVVGSSVGTNVYFYFGSASGYPSSPNVTIQGTAPQFGRSLAVVGDLNKDGRPDIAIGSPREGDGYVYVFYGRDIWPTTIAAPSANVVIYGNSATDSRYLNGQLGRSVARIGDFNNDGVDDFAIGVPYYYPLTARNAGQVVVVYGKSGGIASPVVLPTQFGTSATRIDGDTTVAGRLGFAVAGAGYFYSSSGGTALLAAAPHAPTTAGTSAGRLYSFAGRTGTPTSIAVTGASNTFDSPTQGASIGFYGIATLGNIGPAGQPGFGVAYLMSASGYLQAKSGTPAEGPFGESENFTTSGSSANFAFAQLVSGSGISGTGVSMSVIGGTRADLVVSVQASNPAKLYMLDGAKIGYGGSAVAENISDVSVSVMDPTIGSWGTMAAWCTLIRDADGDGVSDIVVGDVGWSTPIDGRIVVLR